MLADQYLKKYKIKKNQMNFSRMHIPEVAVIEPKVHGDERGYFCGNFSAAEL